ATEHVNSMKADLAGTDILPPLQRILGQPANPDYPRQIFVLTDGEVNNTPQVIEYVSKNCGSTRVFTFGIGSEASPELVCGLAKAGRGEAEFIVSGASEGNRLEAKVLRQLRRALQPVIKKV